MSGVGPLGCPCGGRHLEVAWTYDAPPDGETRFPALVDVPYRRTVRRCAACEHFVSEHAMDLGDLYGGGYWDATYGDRMRATFARIVALPAGESDNLGRVERVDAFARDRLGDPAARALSALDVGSGLCVFLHGLVARGWRGTALDPDERAARHAREVVGVEAVAGDAMTVEGLGGFDLVALNKVIEHVGDPVALLRRCAGFARPGGLLYVEVPDGPSAAREGPGREEFFIEHHHAFSPASLAMACARAGLSPLRVDRLREPSGKHTVSAFLAPVR